MLLRQLFLVNTIYDRITDNNRSTRWPKRFIVCVLWLVFAYISVLKIIALFWNFSNDGDLWPAWWRYSLCFSSLMVFSWSSNVSFGRAVADDIYINKFDQWVSWLVCTANRLRIRSIECITEVPCFSLHIIVVILLGSIVEKFINTFIPRANFCFEKFNFFFKCGNYSFINVSLIFFFVAQGLILVLFHFV